MGKNNTCVSWFCMLLITTYMMILPFKAFAVPAYDGNFELRQSSGYSFNARQFGDEWHNWIETTDGYGICQNALTSDWEYYMSSDFVDARKTGDKGYLPPGERKIRVVVGAADPASLGIPKGLHPPGTFEGERQPFYFQTETELARTTAISGAMHLLVIGVDYATTTASYRPSEILPQLFGATNSIADYYEKTSYSAVVINPAVESYGTSNDGFIGWLRLRGSHPNQGDPLIAKNAILAADPFINYALYDYNSNGIIEPTELSIIVIVAGYEAAVSPHGSPSLWAHTGSMGGVGYPIVDGKSIRGYAQFGEIHGKDGSAHVATLGVMAHELGHLMFSLPDLYDTTNGDSEGVGYFDLMASGCWGAKYGNYGGSTPTYLSAWSKEYLSWGTVNTISLNQFIHLPKADGNKSSTFRINIQDTNQYFLIENRQCTGYDIGFQRKTGESGHGGLAIYHIDSLKTGLWPNSNTVNADENSKGVDVEEANEGGYGSSMLDNNLARVDTGMFYFAGNNTSFTDTSLPGSRLKNGASTNISIIGISAYGDMMDANIILTPATVIELVSFTAEAGNSGEVRLSWETGSEVDNAGFNLYRSRLRDGEYKKINDTIIPSGGNATTGASYSYEDTPPARGTYYYKMEDVDYHGVSTMHGPEKVRVRK